MNITASTADLASALARVAPVAQAKTTLPILACVRLTSDAETLALDTTDLEVTASTSIGVQSGGPAVVCVNARALLDTIKGLRHERVTLERTGDGMAGAGWLNVRAGSSKARLPCIHAAEFPQIKGAVEGAEVDPAQLADALDRIAPMVGKGDDRPNLTGAYLDVEHGSIVGTDGHRIGVVNVPLPLDTGAIVPLKACQMAAKLLRGATAATLAADGPDVAFSADGDVLRARIIDGTFPAYRQILPAADRAQTTVRVERAALVDALRYVGMFVSAKTRMLVIEATDEGLRLHANDPDKGECGRELGCEVEGATVKAGFNAAYLLDALTAAGGDEVVIGIVDTLSPVTVARVGAESDAVFVVMPMRL